MERTVFAEISKSLDIDLKIISLDYRNNYRTFKAWWAMLQKVLTF